MLVSWGYEHTGLALIAAIISKSHSSVSELLLAHNILFDGVFYFDPDY